VALEVSDAILTRLMLWAKAFAFVAGGILTLLALVLGFFGVTTYRDFKRTVGDAQSTIQPMLARAKDDASKALSGADDANRQSLSAIQTIESERKKIENEVNLASTTASHVQSLSGKVSELQTRTTTEIAKANHQIETDLNELKKKLEAATDDIAKQQRKLASTDELVKTLFSKGTTQYFQTNSPSPTLVVVPRQNGASVFMLLTSAPIYQTIELKFYTSSQPRASYSPINNVLFFNWGDPPENLKAHPLEVTYVPDPTSKIPPFKTLYIKNGAIFADETKIMDIAPPK